MVSSTFITSRRWPSTTASLGRIAQVGIGLTSVAEAPFAAEHQQALVVELLTFLMRPDMQLETARALVDEMTARGIRGEVTFPPEITETPGAAAYAREELDRLGPMRGGERVMAATFVLVCGLCGTEWPVSRIRCPACGEEDPARLPAFQSETLPGTRIEACEVCRRYVKSVDLTLDGRPVPEVDDLASIAMDLWAIEQGYERIEPGWAGI